MRVAMEPLTIAAGVDVFFYGESPTGVFLSRFPTSGNAMASGRIGDLSATDASNNVFESQYIQLCCIET